MSIIKITRILEKDLGLKEKSIHDPFFLNISEPKIIIPKGTELEFHVHNKKNNFIWKKEKYILSLSFINLLNNYLKKPLPIK
jgi:hypothetical protein